MEELQSQFQLLLWHPLLYNKEMHGNVEHVFAHRNSYIVFVKLSIYFFQLPLKFRLAVGGTLHGEVAQPALESNPLYWSFS